ncbi:hypothetical protein BH09DEP1_BH09DEP1_3600 [soil metagenome]
MQSLKKLILLVCLAGSASSMHANKFTQYCNLTFDGWKCSVSKTLTSARNGLNNTKDAVKNTASPVIDSLKSTAQFTAAHPVLVGSGALAATLLYLSHCRSKNQGCYPTIAKAREIIKKMNVYSNEGFTYWRLVPGKDKPALPTAKDIMKNHEEVFAALFAERNEDRVKDPHLFINWATKQINKEKEELNKHLNDLKNYCLAECSILPSFSSVAYKAENNFVTKLIDQRIEQMEDSKRFIDLDSADINFIDSQVKNKTSNSYLSYLNPLRLARNWALPYELEAIDQYWKVYQLVQRLEAMQECLQWKKEELNGRTRNVTPRLAVVAADNLL